MLKLIRQRNESKSLHGQFRANIERHNLVEREERTHNSNYPKAEGSSSKDRFAVYESLVFQIKLCGKISPSGI